METTEKRTFNKRAFTSVAMFFSGLLLPVSGIINHQIAFTPLTREHHFWMSVHNISALIFIVCAIAHIIYNRKALINYINKVKTRAVSREALYAAIMVIGVVWLFSSHALHVR